MDEATQRELHEPLLALTWGMTSLMTDLTAPDTGDQRLQRRSATAPSRAYIAWTTVADRLGAHLDARVEALERRDRLVQGAAALLLLLGLVVFAAHRHRRRRLRETRALYRTLVERLPAVTYVLDGDRIVYVSPKLSALLDRDPDEWIADPDLWLRSVHPGEEHADLEYLQQRIPPAFARTFDGVDRVSTIMAAMKSFSHAAGDDMAPADLNEGIRTTLVVCANEYKYVAQGVPLAGQPAAAPAAV